jgi:hypothetical protein
VDGQPHFNRRRAVRVFKWFESEQKANEFIERTSLMTSYEVYASLDAMDAHYRDLSSLMRIGYPEVRAADIAALEQMRMHTSPLTEAIMPALSRYYQLTARAQADRRATQLAYATELFKARYGRYPESLAELPGDRGDVMKIDPFTGDYFGYELTEDGPRIYSRSEDGLDGGGVHAPRWGDQAEEGASDDYVFYPPQEE